jgi:hypothetical protein
MSVIELQKPATQAQEGPYLLDCPFCGHPPELTLGLQVMVECTSAECSVHPKVSGKHERAVAMSWNRRAR